MTINLLPILNSEGNKLSVNEVLDFSDVEMNGVKFSSVVEIAGNLVSIGNSIDFCGSIKAEIEFLCDRCTEKSKKVLNIDFSECLKKGVISEDSADYNPDIIYFNGNTVDVDKIILNNIFMNIPTKLLCSKDCMGLCPDCGTNLNQNKCNCDNRPTDPRFDILDKFFD